MYPPAAEIRAFSPKMTSIRTKETQDGIPGAYLHLKVYGQS